MFVATDIGGGSRPQVGAPPPSRAIDDVEVPLAAVIGLINASTGRLVALVAQALETGIWAQAGIRSPEHWLAWKGGVSLGAGPQARHAGQALARAARHHRRAGRR